MVNTAKTVIVTGGSQGIGAGVVKAFLDRDYNVVATSRNVTKSKDLPSSPKLVLVDGESAASIIDEMISGAEAVITKRLGPMVID
jgi:NAD(P)-dependent dehydrogenase (short-subunit alcohol dehydrogenase family)